MEDNFWVDYAESCRQKKNDDAIEYVKENITYPFDLILDIISDNDWDHMNFDIEVEKSEYHSCFYPTYDFYTIVGEKDKIQYMKQDEDGDYHNMVYQRCGVCEDDYYGFLLFPLKDGKYWKISYSC